jgi:hypothetical protein
MTLKVLRQENGGNATEMVLESGLAYFELQAGSGSGQMRVRFSDSVVTASGFTVLRIDLDNAPGEVAVFSGNAHMERGNALALDLHGGESVSLSRADVSGYNLAESIEPDSWDAWNADRDQTLQAEFGAKTGATKSFVDNNNPAWADLDANGNWYNVPGQGYVWSPYDAGNAGWDPYGNGNWMWTPRFGYMWVSGDPWGYMPFQCGAWNYYNSFGWGWAPGMGMCQPWWGMGGGGWISNIGYAPGGYRPPMPPHPRPGPPHRPIGHPISGGGKLGPYPLVAVNRRPASGSFALPARDRSTPVVIAGHLVQPLRPVSPRPQYDRPATGFVNRPAPASQEGRTAGVPARPAGSIFGGGHPGNTPAPRSSGGSQPAPAASHASSGGASASHSSGGGGGGGSHSSGGSSGGSHH